MRTYKEHIRDSFSGFGRKGLLNKLINAIEYYNKDQYEKAIKTLLTLRKKCKTSNEHCAVLTFIALCYDELRYFTPVIDAYCEILALDPTRSTVHSNLGLLYRRMGEYAKAIECFHAAIERDLNNPYAYNNLGFTYYRMAEYEAAVSHSGPN